MRLTSCRTILWLLDPVTRELRDREERALMRRGPTSVHLGEQQCVPVHVHIMAAEVEGDEELEEQRPGRIRRRKVAQQTGRCTTVGALMNSYAGAITRTYRSTTISNTAPNFEVWWSIRAAWPSAASKSWDMPYASVEYLGWYDM